VWLDARQGPHPSCQCPANQICRGYPRVTDALRKVDIEAIMFFLGGFLDVLTDEIGGVLA
jgi:hypothetical protein